MTYLDLRDEREREIWRAEILEMALSSKGGEHWASQAIERHRECYSGPVEAEKARRRSLRIAKSAALSEAELTSISDRCNAEALIAVPALPPGHNGRQRYDRQLRIRAFATLALQMLVGTTFAAKAMGITEQGARGRAWVLRRDHPDVAAKVFAFVDGFKAEQRQEQKEKAA
jgi:hypothetical protein